MHLREVDRDFIIDHFTLTTLGHLLHWLATDMRGDRCGWWPTWNSCCTDACGTQWSGSRWKAASRAGKGRCGASWAATARPIPGGSRVALQRRAG